MSKYVLTVNGTNSQNNAGSKAANDAIKIVNELGYQSLELYRSSETKTRILDVVRGLLHVYMWRQKLKDDDVIFLQYPMNRYMMGKIYHILKSCGKKIKVITLIHDVDFLRNVPKANGNVDDMKKIELSLLSQSDVIIAHNNSMIHALRKEGLESKYVSLEIFDYLYKGKGAKIEDIDSVIVAGNLLQQKAGYLYKLDSKKQHFNLALYGSNLSEDFHYEHAKYYGSFSPDELIKNLVGTYGLVWDGDMLDTCAGNYGKYLKVNNPHKVSLYLAAGLPVIVWKKSALYPFIKENEVGFGIDSLTQIDNMLEEAKTQYGKFKLNAENVGERIRNGFFLEKAIKEAEKM